MGQQRGTWTIVIIIILVILPSAMSLGYYQITKDPSMRPLGITRESLWAFNGGAEGIEIVAQVQWNRARSGRVNRAQLQSALLKAFKAKGVEARVVFVKTTSNTTITYVVGSSSIGPYPQSRAAEGISAAVDAYRMFVPYKR